MPTERELIQQALHDAIGWQSSLADAHANSDDGVRDECRQQIKRYRALLVKRYGTAKTGLDQALEGAQLVGLDELRRLSKGQNDETR